MRNKAKKIAFNRLIMKSNLIQQLKFMILLNKIKYTIHPLINFSNQPQQHKKPHLKGKLRSISVRQALNSAMLQQMERDQSVYLIGQEVGSYHGAYKVSKGLLEKFGPQRVIDTPISQAGFTGIAIGSSFKGLKPILQYMTMNFALQAIDSIINSCSKIRYMSSGILDSPIVIRGLNGPAAAVAAQHSQCFASWYGSVPGLVVLSPYDAEDCRGLLKSAIRDPNPVIFLQNQLMYSQNFVIDQEIMNKDYLIPIGKAKIMRQGLIKLLGKDVTIVAFSRMVKVALDAAKQLEQNGVSAQVINLRSIRPLDRKTIIQSVKKTNHIVSIQDGYPQHGIGSQICALLFQSQGFSYLDAPLQRVTGVDIPMPYSKFLQQRTTPRVQDVIRAVQNSLQGI